MAQCVAICTKKTGYTQKKTCMDVLFDLLVAVVIFAGIVALLNRMCEEELPGGVIFFFRS